MLSKIQFSLQLDTNLPGERDDFNSISTYQSDCLSTKSILMEICSQSEYCENTDVQPAINDMCSITASAW